MVVVRFFIFCGVDSRWLVIGNRRAHHEHIAVARRAAATASYISSLVVIAMTRARLTVAVSAAGRRSVSPLSSCERRFRDRVAHLSG